MIRIKRYTALIALLLSFEAVAQSGEIVLDGTSVTAGEIIRAIESQTDYHFSYNKSLFDVSRTVTVARRTVSLREALENMTGGQSARWVVHKNYIAIVPATPQPRVEPDPLTSDRYDRSDPNAWNGPAPRPVTPAPAPVPGPAPSAPSPVPVPEPTAPYYSDYGDVAIYANTHGRLPRFAAKTNLLYGLGTLTPNIAAEVALAPKWTLEAAYSTNPWNWRAPGKDVPSRKLLHGIARVEGRYWLCERFSGHFIGVHALYSEFNVSGWDIPLLFEKEYRYHGNAWGGGVAWGYDLPLGRSWNLELTAGVGVYRMNYKRYSCVVCSEEFTPIKKTWVGPSRLGITIEFLIK
jgi:hypothetical protein